MELVTGVSVANPEDPLGNMSESSALPDDREFSYRLLRHCSYSLCHKKYHGLDIVTVYVQVPK